MLETGDVDGMRERDFPSFITVYRALVSLRHAESQAHQAQRVCRSSMYSCYPSCPRKAGGLTLEIYPGLTVLNPHQVSKMSSL